MSKNSSKKQIQQQRNQKARDSVKKLVKRAAYTGGEVALNMLMPGMNLGSIIRGNGDYSVSNSLVKGVARAPSFKNAKDSLVYKAREYVGNVTSSATASAFSNVSYSINPGLAASFPFLSGIAQNFELYAFDGLVYEYVPACTDSNTTMATGTIVLSYDADPSDIAPLSKQLAEASEGAISSKVTIPMLMGVECKRSENVNALHYVRSGVITDVSDLRGADLGNLNVSVVGVPEASIVLGELWVTYNIKLLRKQNAVRGGTDSFTATTYNTTSMFGSARSMAVGSNTGCTMAGAVITFPDAAAGSRFLLTYSAASSAALTGTFAPTYTNCGQLYQSRSATGDVTGPYFMIAVIQTYSAGASVSYTVTFGSNPTSINWYLTILPPDLVV